MLIKFEPRCMSLRSSIFLGPLDGLGTGLAGFVDAPRAVLGLPSVVHFQLMYSTDGVSIRRQKADVCILSF